MRLRKIQRHGEDPAEEGDTKRLPLRDSTGGEKGASMRLMGNKTRPILESQGRQGGGSEQEVARGGPWRGAGDG